MKKFLRLCRHPIGLSVIALLVILVGLAGAYWVGWPLYKDWRETRWLNLAHELYENEEPEKAMDALRKVLQQNPENIEAWRLGERLTREQGSPQRAFFLRQLSELEEDDMDVRLDLAEVAIRQRSFETALESLQSVDEATMETPRFNQLAASLALALGQFGRAEYHLQEVERLSPDDDSTRLGLATIRLQHPDDNVRQEAAEVIRSLRGHPELDFRVQRTLLTRAILEQDREEGLEMLRAMRDNEDQIAFSDRLLLLHGTMLFEPDDFASKKRELQQLAEDDTRQVSMLAAFLIGQQRVVEARQWLESLPEEIRHDQMVLIRLIEALTRLNDLPALEQKLRIEWDENNYFRLAMLSQTLRALGEARQSRDVWQRAVIAAGSEASRLRTLYEQVGNWGWEEERYDLLRRIFQNDPRNDWAFETYTDHLHQQENTQELVRAFSRRMELQSGEETVSNNFALLSLLLNTNRSRAQALAQQNFDRDPENPYFVTTYAYSLYRQGRMEDALERIRELDEETRTEGPRALYYAVILAANERMDEAEPLLEALSDADLLPEERTLRDRTLATISEART